MALRKHHRQGLLLVVATSSLVVATAAGFYYWDAFLLGVAATLLWVKKLFTLVGLLGLLKKLPFILLGGGKKLLVKTLGGLMLYSARSRFRVVRKLIVLLKLGARFLLRRMRYHWNDMAPWERWLVGIGAVPLILGALAMLLLFAVIPRSLRHLLTKKVGESAGAKVIDKAVPKKPREKLSQLHEQVKKQVGHWAKAKNDGRRADDDKKAGASGRDTG